MIYETIFRRVMLRFECAEERFFCAKDLDRARGVFRQVQQRTRMGDESCADEFADKGGKVRCNSDHAIAEVFGQLCSVL